MNTVTHIAGLVIDAPGRTIQRCALCGFILADSKGAHFTTAGEGIGTWATGRLVQMTVGENPTRYTMLPETDTLPDDNCLPLVE